MLRHLKNANELVLYAAISCGAAYLSRLVPPFHFPIMLLRLGILGYWGYMMAIAQGNKDLAVIIGGSLLIGMIGGYWDLIEVHSKYVSSEMVFTLTMTGLAVLVTVSYVLNHRDSDGKTRQKSAAVHRFKLRFDWWQG
ncbi:hypothetical protein [Microseira wollei]|uniref:Ycf66 family protein n=1 Tax=Microseira wollei NIES-4236 TaxID=2530354 RepID=A0AAV3XRZ1_9CYAN|nr:hypothetical protein [Microseira wollei]GET43165.1 hypothetical protein MiSe_79860 [Microseira wollei NIES-4236]